MQTLEKVEVPTTPGPVLVRSLLEANAVLMEELASTRAEVEMLKRRMAN